MNRLGKLRWRIEAFFKTMKQHFSAARFTFRRLKAVLRWFFFCWLAYLLSYWVVLALDRKVGWIGGLPRMMLRSASLLGYCFAGMSKKPIG